MGLLVPPFPYTVLQPVKSLQKCCLPSEDRIPIFWNALAVKMSLNSRQRSLCLRTCQSASSDFSPLAPHLKMMFISTLTSATLDVTVPLLGGKVHGSLARAGKVKHQTPKV